MGEVQSKGVTIRYTEQGRGEPALLFLPSWCTSKAVFAPLLPPARDRYHPIALDWRGHGESDDPPGDFTMGDLVEDALTVINATGVGEVVPIAHAHAGWVALELRKRLGPRVPKIIAINWIMTDAPAELHETVANVQRPDLWPSAVKKLVSIWTAGSRSSRVAAQLNLDMGRYAFPMWARAARETLLQYERYGNPLLAIAELKVPTLHVYAQPTDEEYLLVQRAFAIANPFFEVKRVNGRTRFPMFEVADEVNAAIDAFLGLDPDSSSWISPA